MINTVNIDMEPIKLFMDNFTATRFTVGSKRAKLVKEGIVIHLIPTSHDTLHEKGTNIRFHR